jgi:hypothetical protein
MSTTNPARQFERRGKPAGGVWSRRAVLLATVVIVAGTVPWAPAAPPDGSAAPDGTPSSTAKGWKKISPEDDVWIDTATRQVKISGEIVLREGPLELFACLKQTKEHEAIVACTTKAYVVHAALLAVGAVAGRPVQFRPEYKPAAGSEIDVLVEWTDADGKVQRAKAQDWIRNTQTSKSLDQPWVFGGSSFWQDETTGEKFYQAESGDFICVSNFPSAMLDLPVESSPDNDTLLFEAWSDRIPQVETKVTLYLTPKLKKPAANGQPAQRGSKPPALRPTRTAPQG